MKKLLFFVFCIFYSISISSSQLYDICMKKHDCFRKSYPSSQKILRNYAANKVAESLTVGFLESESLYFEQSREIVVDKLFCLKECFFDNQYFLLHENEVAKLIRDIDIFVGMHRNKHDSFDDLYLLVKKSPPYVTLLKDFPALRQEFHQKELLGRFKKLYNDRQR